MTWSDDKDSEMRLLPLDANTAERLLAGTIAPEDAPPGYAEVARLLTAISAEATHEELGRERETIELMAAAVQSSSDIQPASPRSSLIPFALSRARIRAALVAALLACTAALASAGSLPGAAQDIASDMLAKVGISVPGPNDDAGSNPGVRGRSNTPSSASEPGTAISDLATSAELRGIAKGAAVSSLASDGQSQAGTHGGASTASNGSPPVATPNEGGTGTADTASGGASEPGTSTADTASGGHSTAGSGNADSGQETADEASGGNSTKGQSHKP